MSSIRCRISGCDLDECGTCRRCGSESAARHDWQEADRTRACFARKTCSRCEKERESPDHDWESSTGPAGDIRMKCTRCGLAI